MGGDQSAFQRARQIGVERAQEIFENLKKDNLWKRILKNVIATTAAGIDIMTSFQDYLQRANTLFKSEHMSDSRSKSHYWQSSISCSNDNSVRTPRPALWNYG